MGDARYRPLPFRERAFVEDSKLGYYLDERWRDEPGSKVKLVRDILGFADPAELRLAIIEHAQRHDAVQLPDRGHGRRYNVAGPMEGPSGAVIRMVSGWIVQPGMRAPRNVTLFPAPRRGR